MVGHGGVLSHPRGLRGAAAAPEWAGPGRALRGAGWLRSGGVRGSPVGAPLGCGAAGRERLRLLALRLCCIGPAGRTCGPGRQASCMRLCVCMCEDSASGAEVDRRPSLLVRCPHAFFTI